MKQYKHDLSKYTHSAAAYWINGLGISGSSPKGVVGVTPKGRVEFVLDNGKVLFSAPACLITFQPRLQGNMQFYVGPRQYNVRLYRTSFDQAPVVADTGMLYMEKETRDAGKNIGAQFAAAAKMPDDHQPVIATAPTEAMQTASRTGFRATLYSVLVWAGPVMIVGALFGDKLTTHLGPFWLVVLAIVYTVAIYFYPLSVFEEWREAADAKVLSESESKTLDADILPPGTRATKQHVVSNRALSIRVLLIMFVGVPATFFLILFIIAIIATRSH